MKFLLTDLMNKILCQKLTPEQIKLTDYLNKQSDGEIYLNYIWGSDNNLEVYFRTNSLCHLQECGGGLICIIGKVMIYIFDSNKFYSVKS